MNSKLSNIKYHLSDIKYQVSDKISIQYQLKVSISILLAIECMANQKKGSYSYLNSFVC